MNSDIENIVNEYMSNTYYSATNEPARKDFVPVAGQRGYSFPYQSGGSTPTFNNPDELTVQNSPQMLWPMQSILEDMADSYTYLTAAISKMKDCLQMNAAATDKQRQFLEKMVDNCKIINQNIFKVAEATRKKFDLSEMVDKSTKI